MVLKRANRQSHFSQIPNVTLRDTRLKHGPYHLLMYMLSMADGWVFRNSVMAKDFGTSERTIQEWKTDLVEAGYISRQQQRSADGKIVQWDFIVRDIAEKPDEEKQHVAKD